MSTIDRLLHFIAPHDCLGCQKEGSLLCQNCAIGLPEAPPECYFCRQPMPASLTCLDCFRRAQLRQVVVSTLYAGLAKQLVWRLKFGGAQAAVQSIVTSLPELSLGNTELTVVPVPTATSRRRRRGYDQSGLMAKYLSKVQGHAYLPCLRRLGQAHQLGADRQQRLRQLADAFIVVRPQRVMGHHILLIDDVITTGATFETAAQALYRSGASVVSALAFARGE